MHYSTNFARTMFSRAQIGALCYWGLTNNLQLNARPVFSFGMTSIFELYKYREHLLNLAEVGGRRSKYPNSIKP